MFYLPLPHVLRCYSKKKPSINRDNILKDVIISFTTTPPRIHKIWPTLNSILLQSHLPSKIYLWIPKQYKRFDNAFINQLPDFLKNNPLIDVKYIEKDWGPATKLLPCLEAFKNNPDMKIIVIDDDRIYPSNFISEILRCETRYPNAAICQLGEVITNKSKGVYKLSKTPHFVDILSGYKGYLVKPKFFSNAIFDYPVNLPEAFYEDDVWISGHLKQNAIPRISLPLTQWDKLIRNFNQNILLSNFFSLNGSLCKHENKSKLNFKKTWEYLKNKKMG